MHIYRTHKSPVISGMQKKNTSHAEIFALTIHSQKTNSASFVYKGKLWFKGYFLVSFKNKYVSYVLLGVA